MLEDIKTRDHNDSTRKTAPAIPADDAVMLDNSMLDIDGTVNAVIDIIKSKVEL